jgi:hypothetical protein
VSRDLAQGFHKGILLCMDRVGNFEDVAVGGCIYLYSGTQSGFLAAASGPKKDRGILQESFVLDSAPSGLVRAYNHKGIWKLRFITFRLCSEGAQLLIYRPSRRPPNRGTAVANTSQDVKTRWDEDAAFAVECVKDPTKYKSSIKVDLVLGDYPITVRKLSLTTEVGGVVRKDPNFALKCANGVRSVVQRAEHPFVVQVCLERTGLLEFCGRDAEHLETWLERIMMVSIVHRTYHQTQRIIRNVQQYPAPQNERGAFTLSVAPKGPKDPPAPPMESMLSVKQSAVGFAMWLIAEQSGSQRYFRVAFDEAPLLLPECAVLSAIEVTPDEHDQCLLATSPATLRSLFEDKRSVRVRIERASFGSLGKMFYFNKWCSFVSTFCRHYEGTVEDRQLHLPSAASFAFSGSRRHRPAEDADDTTIAASSVYHSDDEEGEERRSSKAGSRTSPQAQRRKNGPASSASTLFGDVVSEQDYDDDNEGDGTELSDDKFDEIAGSPLERRGVTPTKSGQALLSPFSSTRRGGTPPPGSQWRRSFHQLSPPARGGSPSQISPAIGSTASLIQMVNRSINSCRTSAAPSDVQRSPQPPQLDDAQIEALADEDAAICAQVPSMLARRDFIGVMSAVEGFHRKFAKHP